MDIREDFQLFSVFRTEGLPVYGALQVGKHVLIPVVVDDRELTGEWNVVRDNEGVVRVFTSATAAFAYLYALHQKSEEDDE